MDSKDLILIEDLYGAHNYHPLDVVVSKAKGIWMWDVEGQEVPRFPEPPTRPPTRAIATRGSSRPSRRQAKTPDPDLPGLPQRPVAHAGQGALRLDRLRDGPADELRGRGRRDGQSRPRASGVIRTRAIPEDQAEIIACANNFHGRTVTVISFSTEPLYRNDFGPFTPGFPIIPFGDADALEKAITPNTAAFLVEPIQAEAGHPHPARRLSQEGQGDLREEQRPLHRRRDPDRARPGRASSSRANIEDVKPDMVVIGKSLGGGCYPDLGRPGGPGNPGRFQARRARLHVRRQPAGLRRGPRGHPRHP